MSTYVFATDRIRYLIMKYLSRSVTKKYQETLFSQLKGQYIFHQSSNTSCSRISYYNIITAIMLLLSLIFLQERTPDCKGTINTSIVKCIDTFSSTYLPD